MAERLQSYLRTYRKRSGLTQEELAALLGCESGVSICQYERLAAQPSLETALACQAIFGVSVEELFPGIYKKVVDDIVKRAQSMSKQLPEDNCKPVVKLKRRLFEAIAGRHREEHHNNVWKGELTSSPAS